MIKLICVGKLKEKALLSLQMEYLKRLTPYNKFEVIEVSEQIAPANCKEALAKEIMDKEGQAILSKIKSDEQVILLDLHGKMLSSEKLAQTLSDIFTYKSSNIAFVIGGSLGVSEALIKRANLRWCLSELTFTHQMVRILVLEQIYRSYKILNNEPYHK